MPKPKLFSDEYYQRCISLALKSKGKERYGSIILSSGKIIGEGFNRAIAHPSIGKLERIIKQGMANHSEIEAMNDSLSKGFSLEDVELYVAGYFPEFGRLFFKKDYTCVRCIPHMKVYKIKNIYVPAPHGWIKKSLHIAMEEAERYKNRTHNKRLDVIIGKFYIEQLNVS